MNARIAQWTSIAAFSLQTSFGKPTPWLVDSFEQFAELAVNSSAAASVKRLSHSVLAVSLAQPWFASHSFRSVIFSFPEPYGMIGPTCLPQKLPLRVPECALDIRIVQIAFF